MGRLILVRHGDTDMAGRLCGQSDPSLNAKGKERMHQVARRVADLGIERIWCSDLRRAQQSAAILGEKIGAAIEIRRNLREIHFGFWEGLSWDEAAARFPREAQLWINGYREQPAPGGECYGDFTARIDAELSLVHEDEKIALVTHRGVLQHILRRYCGYDSNQAWKDTSEYGSVIAIDTERFFLARNEVSNQSFSKEAP